MISLCSVEIQDVLPIIFMPCTIPRFLSVTFDRFGIGEERRVGKMHAVIRYSQLYSHFILLRNESWCERKMQHMCMHFQYNLSEYQTRQQCVDRRFWQFSVMLSTVDSLCHNMQIWSFMVDMLKGVIVSCILICQSVIPLIKQLCMQGYNWLTVLLIL